jgi:hypothetical protein
MIYREQILDSGNGRARTHDCEYKFWILATKEQALIKYREHILDSAGNGREALIKYREQI